MGSQNSLFPASSKIKINSTVVFGSLRAFWWYKFYQNLTVGLKVTFIWSLSLVNPITSTCTMTWCYQLAYVAIPHHSYTNMAPTTLGFLTSFHQGKMWIPFQTNTWRKELMGTFPSLNANNYHIFCSLWHGMTHGATWKINHLDPYHFSPTLITNIMLTSRWFHPTMCHPLSLPRAIQKWTFWSSIRLILPSTCHTMEAPYQQYSMSLSLMASTHPYLA